MPLYAYRCSHCSDFELHSPMQQVRDEVPCPDCGGASKRLISAPYLSKASSSAWKLIEGTARTAAEPAVVTSPGARPRRSSGTTSNPLHQKLPRPD
ncbi:FmdB family zinc ribbon protein [Arthrobacter sp. 7Tela_A1]|uniref:FmdB family zinc ribbon protein n=1 Tax=Arthrobacter sp. 7Tela_A1 TaxID=3093745 RepID=UPI003BB68538